MTEQKKTSWTFSVPAPEIDLPRILEEAREAGLDTVRVDVDGHDHPYLFVSETNKGVCKEARVRLGPVTAGEPHYHPTTGQLRWAAVECVGYRDAWGTWWNLVEPDDHDAAIAAVMVDRRDRAEVATRRRRVVVTGL